MVDGEGVDQTTDGCGGVVVGGAVGGHVGAVGVGLEEGGHDPDEWCHGNIVRIEVNRSKNEKNFNQDSVETA